MGDFVCDGTEFSCPFCTGKLKLNVPSSSKIANSKNVANMDDSDFSPSPGAQCIVSPSTPVPCQPSAKAIDPGQSVVQINGAPALGAGCKFVCTAKGGLLTVSSSGQSIAKHDEGSSNTWKLVAAGVGVVALGALAVALAPAEGAAAGVAALGVAARAIARPVIRVVARGAAAAGAAVKGIITGRKGKPPPVKQQPKQPSKPPPSEPVKPPPKQPSEPPPPAPKREKISAKERNKANKKRDGTPGNNRAQNKQFDGAWDEIKRKTGRKDLNDDDRRKLHKVIGKKNYSYDDIVEEGIGMFEKYD